MRLTLLPILAALAPLYANAHEGFLNPHLHSAAGHDHRSHDHAHTGHAHHHADGSKKAVVIEHDHAGESHPWLSVTTGLRYTEYEIDHDDANLLESGLGISLNLNSWLQLGVDARYGWFESDSLDDEGWLPPSAGISAHMPMGEHWELGLGFQVQFPGEEPLGADEWELSPELEIRYDTGKWYAGVSTEVHWALYNDEHSHGEHDHEDHHEDHGHEEHEHEHEGVVIHDVIDQHGDTEFVWQATAGVRLFDERWTLEGRVKGYHVIQQSTEGSDRHLLRAGVRSIYAISENLSLINDVNLPITDARRDEWQTSVALQISF